MLVLLLCVLRQLTSLSGSRLLHLLVDGIMLEE